MAAISSFQAIPKPSRNPATWWAWWIIPRSAKREDQFFERNTRGMTAIISVVLLIVTVVFAPQGMFAGLEWSLLAGFALAFAAVGLVLANRVASAGGLIAFLFVFLGLASLFSSGYWAPNAVGILMLIPIVIALVVRSNWVKAAYAGFIAVAFIVIAFYQEASGFGSIFDASYSFSTPMGAAIMFSLLLAMLLGAGAYLMRDRALLIADLQTLNHTLEARVAERTRDLQVAADVSLQITTQLDTEKLLADVVDQTTTAFGWYHVSIFLIDEEHDCLVLRQSHGDIGAQLLGHELQFPFNANHLVPRAAREHQPVLANNVASEAGYMPNPLLPETRAELAIPIMYGGRLLGVLDIHSEQVNRFQPDDVRILRALSDQIAVAVRNSQLYEQVQAARQIAENADKVKSSFLASMSHELRTPLNAIINFSKFMRKGVPGAINAEQSELLDDIASSGQHLLNLINDVLDMSKIEAGALALYIEEGIDLRQVLETAARYAQPTLSGKPVTLTQSFPDETLLLKGDRKRLLQIFLNILANACKFTERGSINVKVEPRDGSVLVSIADTGVGIPPEDAAYVFTAFKQTKSGLRQGRGGTGLGMPICRKLVEAHAGTVWFASRVGVGTTFYVELPTSSIPVAERN